MISSVDACAYPLEFRSGPPNHAPNRPGPGTRDRGTRIRIALRETDTYSATIA